MEGWKNGTMYDRWIWSGKLYQDSWSVFGDCNVAEQDLMEQRWEVYQAISRSRRRAGCRITKNC